MKKFILLILFPLLGSPSFSQTVTDTTSYVVLPDSVARLVIKDLIKGDGAYSEVELLKRRIELTEQKVIGSEAIIENLNKQIENLKLVEATRKEQLTTYESLSRDLQKDLKLQKTKTKLFQATSGVGLLIITALGLGVL